MKRLILPIIVSALIIVACTAKKKVTTVSTESTEAQLTAAKTKFPDVTMETLKKEIPFFTEPAQIVTVLKTKILLYIPNRN